ncbi:cytochrome c oxidase assembly protein CtaG/Cox11 [Artemisia annua]|uniref:Cytochrome c oxidase assembly protein CtaG/Cox11 n=1 Tax=Artemisia annua TaxID=35608 RepID=A0A2U1MYI2_ARTAN|nr:cytochrome c oxidase assembly protein CtaG/Cox11 [Artemisia annua]
MLYCLTGLVFAMVGCTYVAVPLYRRFCQATGYGGTVQRRETVEEKILRHTQDGTVTKREIVVQFNADVSDGMNWKFIPTQREVRVKPGESALAFYTAENCSSTPITGMSTYNVTPMKAVVYFNKIQCFCFEEQRLLPGEQIDMPVFFYIDPEFETDPRMDVPLYRRFCQATVYRGTVQRRETVEEKILRHTQDGTVTKREIVVQFNADVSDGMNWKFIPTQREAAVYFNKIQCFCFEEQRLLPGEQIDMPVFFYIDPEFETDPRMDGIDNIILSYTFFKIAEDK